MSRVLFLMAWDSLPGHSTYWHLHELRFPSGERVYWTDNSDDR